ncbi:MAG: Penicillin amidase precursor [Anaerolineae bacterium]|jgi:penicillin amidase|nr:MAG: Penicillin amidase precursor [Anaerolineae bacterium]
MRTLRRGLIGTGIFVLVLTIILLSAYIYFFKYHIPNNLAKQSFPQTEGQIRISGLDQAVDVYRDRMGIPHIYAATLHDLFFAQGYVHAQDRFWQMDFWRHIGSGRLSEMFGASQVETDAFLRTLGWRQLAEQEYTQLSAESKAILEAYSEGVNAYLKDHQGARLSLEYAILGLMNRDYSPEPWTPIHTLTWAKVMAWDLAGNMDDEIERSILLGSLSAEQVAELYPPYPEDHPSIVPAIEGTTEKDRANDSRAQANWLQDTGVQASLRTLRTNVQNLETLLGSGGEGLGSNSWVVSGSRTSTGKPILVNDPHLGIQMPSIWYQIALHCRPKSSECPFEVAGFSFAGVPGVVIGHNERIAWGFTNVGPDVIDLYIEKVNPQNPNQYEINGQWVDFELRQEIIEVSGSQPVTITVRISRHGPVISDTYGPLKDEVDEQDPEAKPFRQKAGIQLPDSYAIAMRWTALEPSLVFEAIWGFNKARNWLEFRQAAQSFAVPAQNLIYADVDGNIAYQMPGNIPIRAKGDGRLPVPGWTDEYEWTGYIPFDELPYTLNPPQGYIVTANNRVPPADYPYLITTDWDYGFRAQRIVELIEKETEKIDLATMQKLQGDSYDTSSAFILPVLLQIPLEEANLQSARQLLQNWDGQASLDSPAAALYAAFWKHLLFATFGDELPDQPPSGGDRYFEILRHLVNQPDSAWWDDQSTPEKRENRDAIFQRAFGEAVQELQKTLGKDPLLWRWGDLHTATFRNATFGQSGIAPLENLFNRGPFPTGGGASIVNATGWDTSLGYFVISVPSMRMIVDLSNLDNSLTVHTTGQSGHAFHPHYIDMADLWRKIEYYPMWWDEQTVKQNTENHLQLLP